MLSRFSASRHAISRLTVQGTRVISCNTNAFSENSHRNGGGRQQQSSGTRWTVAGAVAAAGVSLYVTSQQENVHASSVEAGSLKKGLPTYKKTDVAKHKTKASRVWVTYKNGVYDVTDYVSQHPGGNKILLGAGGAIDDYWDMYGAHKQAEIFELLEKHRIGNITEVEIKPEVDKKDPYANDPKRHVALIPSAKKPFNAEPPVSLLLQDYFTPNELFFTRNHLPVPVVDPKDYKLDIQVDSENRSAGLDLDKLKTQFPKKTTATTIQCAGNRRSDMVKIKEVKGLNWGIAAIGTAKWTGPCLDDVLKYYGIDIEQVDCEHIQFEGMDRNVDGSTYGASIPIELARLLKKEILLAYEMNGVDIPRDHGYPVRVIIPGLVGARQVKWLNKIVLSKTESTSHWQQRDYKGFNSSVDWECVNFEESMAIQMLPVQSAICEPQEGDVLESDDEIHVRGYAWSGGGRGIYRVDVSADGGKTWVTADLDNNEQTTYKSWAWTIWDASVPVPKNHKGKVELVCKACDAQYNVQPDSVEGIWNLRGCLSNAWHKVNVSLQK